jgi:hypothetical protein
MFIQIDDKKQIEGFCSVETPDMGIFIEDSLCEDKNLHEYSYENGELKTNIDLKKEILLSTLKQNTNYKEPVIVNTVSYHGGWDSVQKLDSKRRLVLELEQTEVKFLDTSDDEHIHTIKEAKTVCLAVASAYEIKLYAYKKKKKRINSCNSIEELDLIEV